MPQAVKSVYSSLIQSWTKEVKLVGEILFMYETELAEPISYIYSILERCDS